MLDVWNSGCVTECWIFNRLAILRTSEYYADWVASHYPLYADSDYNFFFGETSTLLPGYHDPILERKQINLFLLNSDTVVEKIQETIIDGYYLVMAAKIPTETEFYHEVLVYGYDDERRCFLVVEFRNRLFQLATYAYSYIIESFPMVQQHYRENKYLGLAHSLYYQFPLTALRINMNYNPKGCPFETYLKLDDEWSGTCHTKGTLQQIREQDESRLIYRGINCLYALQDMLMWKMDGKQCSDSSIQPRVYRKWKQ